MNPNTPALRAYPQTHPFFRSMYDIVISERFPHLEGEPLKTIADMQFNARLQAYNLQWPNAQWFVIMVNNKFVGHLVINESDANIHLVDLLIMPEFRHNGIAKKVLTFLISMSNDKRQMLSLVVALDNPIIALYQNLGFVEVSRTETDITMQCISQ